MDCGLSVVIHGSYVSVTVDRPMMGYPYRTAVVQTTPFLEQTRGTSGTFVQRTNQKISSLPLYRDVGCPYLE